MVSNNILTGLALGAAAVAVAVAPAYAQSAAAKAQVDAAKAAGTVGEQADGFLGFVTGDADAATRAAVAEINAGRAQLYREAGARNGTSAEAAGASSYTQRRPGFPSGHFYRDADGTWRRK